MTTTSWVFAAVAVLAIMMAVVCRVRERRRLLRIASQVNAWMGADGYRPLSQSGNAPWRHVGLALDALGKAYDSRGERLARERPWRRELVDSLIDPALLFGADGRLLTANEAARTLFEFPAGRSGSTVVQTVGSAAISEAVRDVRGGGEAVTVDVERGDRDLRAVVSQVGDETWVLVADRSRERAIEELRRDFVVNASHELKTPVTAIQTLGEALAVTAGRDPARTTELIRRLQQESERLAHLVQDLLDLRRLEDRGPLDLEPVDLAELARQAALSELEHAAAREVELSVDAPDRAVLDGVAGDLRIVVTNLIGNAVQYNRRGGSVDVSVRVESDAMVLTVRDTGIGIPQQDLGRIFERFYRVDTARSRDTGGTGLGLSIVRHSVERHGGTITVASAAGEGATFTVVLPVENGGRPPVQSRAGRHP